MTTPSAMAANVHQIAPPGNSGVNQYLEDVPTAAGGRPSTSIQAGGTGPAPGGKVTGTTQRTLAQITHMGREGKRAASSAVAGLPQAVKGGGGGSGQGTGAALVRAAGGSSGGMGVVLPLIAAATLIGATAAFVVRRRRA